MCVQAHPMWWIAQSLTTSERWHRKSLYLLGALCHKIPSVHGWVCAKSCRCPLESQSYLPKVSGRCSSLNGNTPPRHSIGRDSPVMLRSDIMRWAPVSQCVPCLHHQGSTLKLRVVLSKWDVIKYLLHTWTTTRNKKTISTRLPN